VEKNMDAGVVVVVIADRCILAFICSLVDALQILRFHIKI